MNKILSDAEIEEAAKTMAELFDYPWEHMPEQGRQKMRDIVGAILSKLADRLEDAERWRAHTDKLDALVTYCPTCCEGFTAKASMSRDEVIFECGKTAGRAAIDAARKGNAEEQPKEAEQYQPLFTTPKQRGELAGDGKPCNNDHSPDCRWPECMCREREHFFSKGKADGH